MPFSYRWLLLALIWLAAADLRTATQGVSPILPTAQWPGKQDTPQCLPNTLAVGIAAWVRRAPGQDVPFVPVRRPEAE